MRRIIRLLPSHPIFPWNRYLQRRLYSIFIEAGDVVFALGTDKHNAIFEQLGAQVVARQHNAPTQLIEQFGEPSFIKFGVADCVLGLHRPIDAFAFHYDPQNILSACTATEYVSQLGNYWFGYTVGGRTRGDGWFSAETTLAYLYALTSDDPAGDIFAIRKTSRAAQKLQLPFAAQS